MIRLLLFLMLFSFTGWVIIKAIRSVLNHSPNFRIYRMKRNLNSRRNKMSLLEQEINLKEEELKLLEQESKLTEKVLKS